MTAPRLRPRPQFAIPALVAALIALALALPAIAAAATEHTLEVEITGNGEGAVGCKVNAGPLEECEAEYEEGTEVTLIAEPELGSEFVEWAVAGDCDTITGEECEIEEMDVDKTVEVVFDLEEFELTVETEGSGEGVVECQVEAGPYELCPASETYPYGTEVTLFAEAEEGSEFVEWEGDCSGVEAECELTVEEPLGVTATFKPEPPFELTVGTAGTGTGTVECEVEEEPAEECEAEYEEGTELTLIVGADAGSEFAGFSAGSGSAAGCAGSCTFTIEADSSVTATFNLIPRTLTITKGGTGTGEVKCKVSAGPEEPCPSPIPNGKSVQVIATSDTGSEFAGFSAGTGSAAGCSTTPCTFTLEANSALTATFDLEAVSEFNLTIAKAGSGSGSVTCDGGACASTYAEGSEVTLAASAASGSTFAGFSGGGCSGTGNCTVTLNADTTVTATFNANPPPPEETCATNPTLCPPPAEGTAKAAASASVSGGKAALKLTCTGGPCKGTLKLTAKVKQGKKVKTLVIGKASFNLSAGSSKTLKVKLSSPAKQELGKGKTIKAKLSGTGIAASTVKLKPAKKR